MAPHDGAAQAEERSPLRLPNKITDSDPQKTQHVRQAIEGDVQRSVPDIIRCFLQNLSIFSTLLPPHWRKLPPELKQFVEKEMFDPVMRQVLEDDNIINWAPSATKLYPLITTGDGNCLLHAVSLAMWGTEDDNLFLRSLLHETLVNHDMESRKRWQRERKKQDERIPGSGLRYNTMEWCNEWDIIIKMAGCDRRPPTAQGLPYESLEEFHVFMLANILRRPIIIMAQSMWYDLQGHSLQPQNFSGVYLPLKWQPEQCSKYPIILGYYQMHFVPLVCTGVAEGETSATEFVVPLIHQDHSPLAIHFLTAEEEGQEDQLLHNYLALENLPHMDINESMASTHVIKGGQLSTRTPPDEMNLMVSYFRLVDTHYRYYLETEYNPQSAYKGTNQDKELEDKMAKANLNSQPLPQSSDLWTPPTNPNYTSVDPNPSTQKSQGADEISRPKDAAHSNPQMILSMVNQNCKTKNCPYYRSISTGEYCHECYSRLQMARKKGGADENNQGGSEKCRTEGCLNFSEVGQNHCQVCKASAKFRDNGVTTTTVPTAPLPSNVLPEQGVHQSATVISNAVLGGQQQSAGHQQVYQSARISSSNGSDDDLTTLLINTQKVGSKKCIMPECQLTGHPQNHDMCQKCYYENSRIHENVMSQAGTAKLEQPPPPQIPQQMGKPSTAGVYSRKCMTQGCQGVGNSKMEGYCSECSLKKSSLPAGTERPKYPQAKEAPPPSIPPPNYDQALKILEKNQAGGYSAPSQQQQQHQQQQQYQQQQHYPGFTVPKHICATPGCPGVRLESGYCFQCEHKNKLAPIPARTQTPPPTPKQSWVRAPAPRSQTPPASGGLQSGALAYPSNKQGPPNSSYGRAQPQQSATRTMPLSHPSTRTCRHPKCDRPAAPPKYILCEECIQIAELYRQEEEERAGQSSKPGAWNAELAEQVPRNQAGHMPGSHVHAGQPKPSPSKKTIPQARAYIPRLKCQAPGGCSDDMFGDPELNNFCSSCFKDSLLRPPFSKPLGVHSAPLRPSPRLTKQQSSNSQILKAHRDQEEQNRVIHVPSNTKAAYRNNVVIATGDNSAHVQVGQVPYMMRCATPDCVNPANPNILEGYCNTCYRAFEEVFPRRNEPVVAQPSGQRYYENPPLALQQQSGKPYRMNDKQQTEIPTPKPTRMPCKHSWCHNYGNPKCFGMCNECYKITLINRGGQLPQY